MTSSILPGDNIPLSSLTKVGLGYASRLVIVPPFLELQSQN